MFVKFALVPGRAFSHHKEGKTPEALFLLARALDDVMRVEDSTALSLVLMTLEQMTSMSREAFGDPSDPRRAELGLRLAPVKTKALAALDWCERQLCHVAPAEKADTEAQLSKVRRWSETYL